MTAPLSILSSYGPNVPIVEPIDPSPAAWRASVAASGGVILESGRGFGRQGQWSLYFLPPRTVLTADADTDTWRLEERGSAGPKLSTGTGVWAAIAEQLARTAWPAPDLDYPLPFAGGWVGYLGYELGRLLEPSTLRRAAEPARPGSRLPDLYLAYVDTALIHDGKTNRAYLVGSDRRGQGKQEVERRIQDWRERLESQESAPLLVSSTWATDQPLRSDLAPAEYRRRVARIVDYIRAGDIFQANFTHRLAAPVAVDPFAVFERLALSSPAPFAAYLPTPSFTLVSNSPERFLLVEPSGRVETRPIKGTRPRGATPAADARLAAELAASGKDLAELTMIVDLERNDLGRVCRFGSVRVEEHAALETYSNVHHLVSTIIGQLRRPIVDLLRAAFPGGSISGAPKVRAMQIIEELEPCRRGPYCGALGYFSDHGRVDLNIAIRTAVVEPAQVHFHVGSGIVADSDPEAEYQETLTKGRRLAEALGLTIAEG